MPSSADWLADSVQKHPNRVCVIHATTKRQHSFLGFDNRANQIAHFCDQWVGLIPGDRIGLLSTPSDDMLQIVVAAGKLGLTALLLDPNLGSEILVEAVNHYGPRTLFHGLPQAELVQKIWFEVNSVEQLIPLRSAVDTASFEDIVAYYPPTPPVVEIDENVPWVHFAAAAEITWPDPNAAKVSSQPPDERPWIIPTPLHQADGLAAAVTALRLGQCAIIREDSVEVIESPGEIGPSQEDGASSQRNVPTGRSWLPHEFL